jgi:hypothetical protein
LKLYSAISFLRSSSALFLAFLLFQNHTPNRMAAAIAAIGIMTAIAIVAPVLSPFDPDEPEPEALRVEGVEEAEVDEPEDEGVKVGVSTVGAGKVLVITTIDGC